MSEFIGYPKIGQYSNALQDLNHMGIRGTVLFTGTVKLHGTNGGIRIDRDGTVTAQSRNRDLTVDSDNYAFARYVNDYKDEIYSFVDSKFSDSLYKTIVVYGEWAGEGIQNKVGVSKLKPAFYAFEVLVVFADGTKKWFLDTRFLSADNAPFRSICDYGTWSVLVDLSFPEQTRETLIGIMRNIEASCPVALKHGVDGIGEGAVFKANVDGKVIRFKVKGEEHSATKVKVIASVDSEKHLHAKSIADAGCTEVRFEQALSWIKEMGKPIDLTSTGDFIKWVQNDILSEERDVIDNNDLSPSDVSRYVGVRAAKWFKEKVS